jgi:peptide/nickel transport system permease protein
VARFLATRLAQALVVLALMSVVIYGLIGLMPGDPIDLALSADPNLTSSDIARLRALYGLDKPWLERYWAWATHAVQGEFGYSRLFASPVLSALAEPLGRTVLLMGISFLIGLGIGIPAGLAAGARPHSRLDYAVNLICFAGVAMPAFWLALLMIMLFSVTLQWLPASAVSVDPGIVPQLYHLILPAVTLGLLQAGGTARYMRASIRDALAADHIRTAHAKGLSGFGVLWHHAMRNALIPVVSILALDVGGLFSGALIIELMFGYPGMGKLLFDAVMGNDFNLALVALLFATCVTLAANLLADIAYAIIDPRISFGNMAKA